MWRRTARGVVLRPTHSDTVLLLEASARVLWEVLERELTLDEVVQALAEVYDTTATSVREDIEGALARLEDAGVLARVGA